MFPEVVRFMQDINEVIEIFPENKYGEVLRRAEGGLKMENVVAVIYLLVMSFDGNTYKSVKKFMREQESKDETDSFMKIATNVMFTKMYAKAGIKKFVEKAVAVMVKYYNQIYKGPM